MGSKSGRYIIRLIHKLKDFLTITQDLFTAKDRQDIIISDDIKIEKTDSSIHIYVSGEIYACIHDDNSVEIQLPLKDGGRNMLFVNDSSIYESYALREHQQNISMRLHSKAMASVGIKEKI